MSEEKLKTVLENLHQLPALPSVVLEVINSFVDTEISTALLANKISQDQALSAKLLQISNSSFYGLSRQVGSINEAVMILGFDSVRSLAVAVGLIHALSPVTGQLLNRKQFWQYNIQVATCAQFLAKTLGFNADIAFTAGLLHDIGQMAFALTYPQSYGIILEGESFTANELVERERQEFGFDHAMLGAEVARHWNFPLLIQNAIKYHHCADSPDQDRLAEIVYTANFLHERYREGKSEEDILSELPENILNRMNSNNELLASAWSVFTRSDIGVHIFE